MKYAATQFAQSENLAVKHRLNRVGKLVIAVIETGFQSRFQRFNLTGQKGKVASLLQSCGLVLRHRQARDVVQCRLYAKQSLKMGASMH